MKAGWVVCVLFLSTPALLAQTVTLVNIIPAAKSNEFFQDSEPSIAIDPTDQRNIAVAAMTNDSTVGPWAPIFVSTNRGLTWASIAVIPSIYGAAFPFVDPSLSFSGTRVLYTSLLRAATTGSRPLSILRKASFTDATSKMSEFGGAARTGVDQPHVQVRTVNTATGLRDLIFVGSDDYNIDPTGRTATVDQYMHSTSSFKKKPIESRPTSNRDGAPIRLAVFPTGKAYGAFLARRTIVPSECSGSFRTDVVVVRDDLQGTGERSFAALKDPSDNRSGKLVARNVFLPRNRIIDQDRIGYDLAIAVHPSKPEEVYIAWSAMAGGGDCSYRLKMMRSTDHGVTWVAEPGGVVRLDAKNPSIAVNSAGVVALLYQQPVSTPNGRRWQTKVDYITGNFTTRHSVLLVNQRADQPTSRYLPYLGDYTQIVSQGNTFFGVFSASNYPDRANFHSSIIYNRKVNFIAHKLMNVDNTLHERFSIDPFFFSLVP